MSRRIMAFTGWLPIKVSAPLLGVIFSACVQSAIAAEQSGSFEDEGLEHTAKMMELLRLDDNLVESVWTIMHSAEEERRALEPTDMAQMRDELDAIDENMMSELALVLDSDQLLALQAITIQNRIHGLTPDGRPLPDMARTGRPPMAPTDQAENNNE